MYTPKAFEVTDLPMLHAAIEAERAGDAGYDHHPAGWWPRISRSCWMRPAESTGP